MIATDGDQSASPNTDGTYMLQVSIHINAYIDDVLSPSVEDVQTAVKSRHLDEIDLLKFIAIIGMVVIHVYECWSSFDPETYVDTPLDILIQFLGGPVCAPLFMIACGVGIVYTRKNRPVDYLRRGIILLLSAYALNFLRRGLLYLLIKGPTGEFATATMLNVDILHLAGLSFILIGILKALRCSKWHVMVLAVIMFAASNIIGVLDLHGFMGYSFGLFVFTDNLDICFPLLGWFIYIAVGVFLGSYLKGSKDHVTLYKVLFVLGAAMFSVVTAVTLLSGENLFHFFTLYHDEYYRQSYDALIWILGIVLMSLSAAYFLMTRCSNGRFYSVCRFYGKNLNRLYIMQWLVIANIGLLFDQVPFTVEPVLSIPIGIAILAAVSPLVPVYVKGTEFLRARFSDNTGTF